MYMGWFYLLLTLNYTTTTTTTTTVLYSLSPLSSLLSTPFPSPHRFFPCLSFASDPSDTVQVRTDKHMAPSLIYRLHQTRQWSSKDATAKVCSYCNQEFYFGGVYTTPFSTQKRTFFHRFGLRFTCKRWKRILKTETFESGDLSRDLENGYLKTANFSRVNTQKWIHTLIQTYLSLHTHKKD